MSKQTTYSHILKYTGLFGGVQGLGILINIIRNKLVAMILGPDGMGLMALFSATVKFVGDSTSLGIPVSAVKSLSHDEAQATAHDKERTVAMVRSWCLLTGLAGMWIMLLLSPLLNRWIFTWGDHSLHFALLSPAVLFAALSGGELAILKGLHELRRLAKASLLAVLGLLVLSVPLFYVWGEAAIVPSLVLTSIMQWGIAVRLTSRLFPLRYSFSKSSLGEGMGMVRLGVAFTVAGIMSSGAEFLIRTFFNINADLAFIGLYNAGYVLAMTYAGMMFSAMDTDYFPRLSAISGTGEELNECVSRQIEVSLLLAAPMLACFMLAMPVILPLLYTSQFLEVLPMVQVAVLAMYLRAIILPIAYLPLSKGDSWSFLLMEGASSVTIVLFVILGWHVYGLTGTGFGILTSAIAEVIILACYMRWKYGYRLSSDVITTMLLQLPLGVAAYLVTLITQPALYLSLGFIVAAASLAISLNILRKKTRLWESLKNKIRKILRVS